MTVGVVVDLVQDSTPTAASVRATELVDAQNNPTDLLVNVSIDAGMTGVSAAGIVVTVTSTSTGTGDLIFTVPKIMIMR